MMSWYNWEFDETDQMPLFLQFQWIEVCVQHFVQWFAHHHSFFWVWSQVDWRRTGQHSAGSKHNHRLCHLPDVPPACRLFKVSITWYKLGQMACKWGVWTEQDGFLSLLDPGSTIWARYIHWCLTLLKHTMVSADFNSIAWQRVIGQWFQASWYLWRAVWHPAEFLQSELWNDVGRFGALCSCWSERLAEVSGLLQAM